MNCKEQIKEETKIPYQFTANPLNLMYIMDSDCHKMLNLLIQEESYWKSKGELVDGYFFKSVNDLKEDMFMSNDQDVRLTIEALYANNIIDVINQGDNHKASKFKIRIDKIMETNSSSITETKKFSPRICKFKRGHLCSYMKRTECKNDQVGNASDIDNVPESITDCSTDCSTNCTPKLNKSEILYKLNNIENNIIDNIVKEKIEEESLYSFDNEIENKRKDLVNINDHTIIDAPAPKAVAQAIVKNEIENNRKDIDNINSHTIIDAPAPEAAAQNIESIENKLYTKEELLIMGFNKDFKEKKEDEFCCNLHRYNINELNYIMKMLPSDTISIKESKKDYVKYWISKVLSIKQRA